MDGWRGMSPLSEGAWERGTAAWTTATPDCSCSTGCGGSTVELELSRTEFARRHGLHATDLRALIALLDAGRAGQRATPGWLAQ